MIKVVVVDDSAVIRHMVSELFHHVKDMELYALFANPLEVMDFLRVYQPDVLVLDIEMPGMDGITLLRKVLAEYDIPTIMFSSLTQKGSVNAMNALEWGAVEVVAKDRGAMSASDGMWDELVTAIRCAASADMAKLKRVRSSTPKADPPGIGSENGVPPKGSRGTHRVIALGASTGGTQALECVLSQLGPTGTPILVVQHMPVHFTEAFAKRLNSVCRLPVKEAVDGAKLLPDEILIAPGGKHLTVAREGLKITTTVKEGPPVSHHCPSVDVLFSSVAEVFAGSAVAVLMTGMGDDGANGMAELYEKGAHTIAQDEATSVVFGMPAAAIRRGVATSVMPLERISHAVSLALFTKI